MATISILTPTIRKKIKQYSEKLQKAGIPVDKLIIFGSYAKGTAKSWSDIDVCVVSKQFGTNRHSERVLLMQAKDQSSLDIEPHPYHPDDLNSKWDVLAHEIRTHGISV